MVRRIIDIAVSSLVLTSMALILAIVAFVIRLTMGLPVFFRQVRIGKGGVPFWLYKFRTMGESSGSVITTERDPRITPLGAVLRRWKIDELPQFWNILRGDMTLIGPRPEAERLVRYYSAEERRVLEQTPGLASMSQLVYPHEMEFLRGHPDPEELYRSELMPKKLAVDLDYERRRTLWSDLKLCGELAILVFAGKSKRIDRTLGSRLGKHPQTERA